MSEIIIRPLSDHDSIAALTELLHRAYEPHLAKGFNFAAATQTEAETQARAETGECYVAVDGEKLVGTVLLSIFNGAGGCDTYNRAGVAVLGQFAVAPDYQNRDLGRRLMETIEQRAKAQGATDIALSTAEEVPELMAWYQRKGYDPVEYITWPGRNYRSAILSKTLG